MNDDDTGPSAAMWGCILLCAFLVLALIVGFWIGRLTA